MAEQVRISLRGGRLIDPARGVDRETDLHLAGGRVLAIGEAPPDFQPDRVYDTAGLVVLSGSSTRLAWLK